MIGIIVTVLILFGLALYAIAMPYLHRERGRRITYAASPSWSGGTKLELSEAPAPLGLAGPEGLQILAVVGIDAA